MSPTIYTPFYFIATFAFIYQKEWIRVPGTYMMLSINCSSTRLPVVCLCQQKPYLFLHSLDVGMGDASGSAGMYARADRGTVQDQ